MGQRINQALFAVVLVGAALFTFQNCSPAKYKEAQRSCTGEGCDPDPLNVQYSWKYDAQWSACTVTCDGGTQDRAVWCEAANGATVEDALCTGAKPVEARECNIQSCSNATHYWLPGPWSDCSNDTQTRTVACYDGASGQVANNSFCPDAPPATSRSCRTTTYRTYVQDVPQGHNQVDILLVVDDSSSMAPEQKKLAQRFGKFVTDLGNSGLDWRACYTTTDAPHYQGAPLVWNGHSSHILTPAVNGYAEIFNRSIVGVGAGYGDDEQGIKSTYLSVEDNGNHKCFRQAAALSVILISDEDERSVGGIQSRSNVQYKPLNTKNKPSELVKHIKATFGAKKRFNFNSIIVRDRACEKIQDQQQSPSFIGFQYADLSNLTGGYVGDICANDYTQNLRYFQDAIEFSLSKVDLGCEPVVETMEVKTAPQVNGLSYTVVGQEVTFEPILPSGTRLVVNYQCKQAPPPSGND